MDTEKIYSVNNRLGDARKQLATLLKDKSQVKIVYSPHECIRFDRGSEFGRICLMVIESRLREEIATAEKELKDAVNKTETKVD